MEEVMKSQQAVRNHVSEDIEAASNRLRSIHQKNNIFIFPS
jgi:hypothetical protein